MWFDPLKALADIEAGQSPASTTSTDATRATRATQAPAASPDVAHVAQVAQPPAPDSMTGPPVCRTCRTCRTPEAIETALPDDLQIALDAFEERAAIREADGGQPRGEAEAAALAEVAQEAGEDPVDLRQRLEAARGAPPLDAGGLPDRPCRLCGHLHYWKSAEAPFEGPGWHCGGCRPAPAGLHSHAVTVPGPAAVPASAASTGAAGLTTGQLRAEIETRRQIYADCGFAPPADTEYALRALADTLGVTVQALRETLGTER